MKALFTSFYLQQSLTVKGLKCSQAVELCCCSLERIHLIEELFKLLVIFTYRYYNFKQHITTYVGLQRLMIIKAEIDDLKLGVLPYSRLYGRWMKRHQAGINGAPFQHTLVSTTPVSDCSSSSSHGSFQLKSQTPSYVGGSGPP